MELYSDIIMSCDHECRELQFKSPFDDVSYLLLDPPSEHSINQSLIMRQAKISEFHVAFTDYLKESAIALIHDSQKERNYYIYILNFIVDKPFDGVPFGHSHRHSDFLRISDSHQLLSSSRVPDSAVRAPSSSLGRCRYLVAILAILEGLRPRSR